MAPGRTYYLNSISKCLTPLLRVGIMAPPPERRSPIMRALRAEVWGSAPYGVEMACAPIELGADTTVDSILRKEPKARNALARRTLKPDEELRHKERAVGKAGVRKGK